MYVVPCGETACLSSAAAHARLAAGIICIIDRNHTCGNILSHPARLGIDIVTSERAISMTQPAPAGALAIIFCRPAALLLWHYAAAR